MHKSEKYNKHLNYAPGLWSVPPNNFSLSSGEIEIWQATLDISQTMESQYWGYLNKEERERADRFVFPKDRRHYIAGRGILRDLLGRYLSVTPHKVHFSYNSFGKPSLSDAHRIKFNISHSAGLILLSFTLDYTIGIDVEKINPEIKVQDLAHRFFSKVESRQLLALPQKEQHLTFFKYWTRKEAFIKAHGEGLSLALDQFDVSILDEEKTRVLKIAWAPEEENAWSLRSFEPEVGWLAAVIIKGKIKSIRFFQFKK